MPIFFKECVYVINGTEIQFKQIILSAAHNHTGIPCQQNFTTDFGGLA